MRVGTTLALMKMPEILYSQGFGTRRVCAGLVQQGLVQVYEPNMPLPLAVVADDATEYVADGLQFAVQGVPWRYAEKAYIALHKPAGYECSHKPGLHPSVYTLLPSPLRMRPSKGGLQGVQAVGRLDQDTTGLLLFSDDGQFIHRMASPKHHVPKVYEARVKHELQDQQIQRLLAGVVLDDDPRPVRAAQARALESHTLELTLTQGKYHQVKRMVAAIGNRVEALHRSRIGGLCLLPDLAPGQWCWLDTKDLELLR